MQPEKLGPYQIERLLGRGGMGAVYVGVNQDTGERAAVKMLAPAFSAEPNFRGRFATEIETLRKLRHPNIVQLYGFGEEHGSLFYAMQLVESDNLENELRKGRQFDWREVIAIALDVSKALKHAHDRGVIHRDLKPANLLRGDDGRILLSDFGIAKLFGGAEFTAAGGVIGTADYMSPEQAAGEGVTPRSDLYSLGAVMFCLLAGRPPFQGRSLPDIIHQVRYTEAPLIGRFAPSTPVELESIIARLLEKDPKRRIPTALALINLFQAMLNTAPQTVLEPATTEPELPDDAFVVTSDVTAASSKLLDSQITRRPTAVVAESPPSAQATSDETVIHTAPPKVDQEGEALSPPVVATPASRFTVVPEEELGQLNAFDRDDEEDAWGWPWWIAGAAAVVGLVLFAWYAMRPPSADRLFARIVQTTEQSDPPTAAAEISEFLERFPDDPRVREIDGYRQEIEVARLERTMERRGRTSRLGEGVSLVEWTYLDAMRTARSDPRQALEALASLIAVYGHEPDDSTAAACVELARKQRERLLQILEKHEAEHRRELERRLKAADALYAANRADAQAIWRGVIDLYGNQPWASAAVGQAQDRLAKASP